MHLESRLNRRQMTTGVAAIYARVKVMQLEVYVQHDVWRQYYLTATYAAKSWLLIGMPPRIENPGGKMLTILVIADNETEDR